MNIPSLITILGFYVIILGIGLWVSRAKEREHSTESLVLGGRKIPLLIGIFTMTATWVGGGYINGTAEQVYANGLLWAQAPWGYAISLILGGLFFARKLRERGYITFLDPFEEKLGKRVTALLFIPALIGEVFWSAAILTALGMTFGTILGFDITTAILISAAIAITYTTMGGLWSVAYTDVVQLIFILGGLVIALPFALGKVGGLDAAWAAYQTEFAAAATLLPSGEALGAYTWQWWDFAFLLMLGGIPWGVYFQRVLSAPSPNAARTLSIFAGLGCIILAIPAVLIGVIGKVYVWDSAPAGAMVLPAVLHQLLPTWAATLGLGAVAAAVMSSVDSSFLSASTMFSCNVYKPLIRPQATERERYLATKTGIVVVGVLATLLALSVQSVYALWYLCSDLVFVVLFPQLVLVIYFKRMNTVGSLAGMAVGLFLRLGGGEPILGIPSFLPYPMTDPTAGVLFPFRTVAMLSSLATIVIVSLVTGRWQRWQPAPAPDPAQARTPA